MRRAPKRRLGFLGRFTPAPARLLPFAETPWGIKESKEARVNGLEAGRIAVLQAS